MASRREHGVRTYLAAMARADLDGVVACFSDDGLIDSPVYGEVPVEQFYRKLFADTVSASVDIHSVYVSSSQPERLAAHFAYSWTRRDQPVVETDLIDLFIFDENDRIRSLRIVFDVPRKADTARS